MKIYKIMTAMIAICFIAGIASAGTFSDAENDNDIHFSFPTMEFAKDGAIHHTYQKGTLTIPNDQIQKPETQEALKAWQYEDIEVM